MSRLQQRKTFSAEPAIASHSFRHLGRVLDATTRSGLFLTGPSGSGVSALEITGREIIFHSSLDLSNSFAHIEIPSGVRIAISRTTSVMRTGDPSVFSISEAMPGERFLACGPKYPVADWQKLLDDFTKGPTVKRPTAAKPEPTGERKAKPPVSKPKPPAKPRVETHDAKEKSKAEHVKQPKAQVPPPPPEVAVVTELPAQQSPAATETVAQEDSVKGVAHVTALGTGHVKDLPPPDKARGTASDKREQESGAMVGSPGASYSGSVRVDSTPFGSWSNEDPNFYEPALRPDA